MSARRSGTFTTFLFISVAALALRDSAAADAAASGCAMNWNRFSKMETRFPPSNGAVPGELFLESFLDGG